MKLFAVRSYFVSRWKLPRNNFDSVRHQCKSIDQVPGPSPSLPIIGTNWIYSRFGKYDLQKLHEANQDKCKRYGPIVREEFQAGHSVIHLFDPNDFETLFRSQGPTPIRPANEFVCHYRAKHPDKYANAGIAHLQGEQWAEQRRLMGPAMLRLGVLDSYLPQLNCITDELIDCIRTGHRIENHIDIEDVQNLTYKLALESVCSLTLDTRIHCFDEEHITSDGQVLVEATKRLFDAYQRLYYAAPWWKLYQTRDFKQLGESESIIYQTAGRYIQNAMDLLDQESELSVKRPSLLRTLVQIKDLDRRDIHTLILDFIAGGINTTSNALAVALHHLASNPEKQENLFNELDRLFPEHRTNGQVTVKSNRLNKSKYLRACLKETFRLDSPIPCVVRTLSTDLHLSGYFIPKGTTVFAHVYTVCRSEDHFPNPLQYEPERWLDQSRKKIHPFASLPFGYGPRMCTGRRFSEMQLQLALIKILTQYRLEALTEKLDIEQRFILIPSHPIAIRFVSRRKQS